jgi:Fur family transcriptional regulator, peroxide stress response regulator
MSRPPRVTPEETARRVAQFKATAGVRGVKLTPQRLEIFREVAGSLEHPDAESVYRAVHARMPTVSLDTVYRTLWMLSELGLVSTLGIRRESVRFDANPEKHHHYVCVRCGLTRDFESAELHVLRLPDTVQGLGSVLSTHIELRGVCQLCAHQRHKRDSASIRRPKGRKGQGHGGQQDG